MQKNGNRSATVPAPQSGKDADAEGESSLRTTAARAAADTIEVRLPAQSRFTSVVRQTVESVCGELEMPASDRAAVQLAVGEACNNAILHAPPPTSTQNAPTVTVSCRICPDALEIDVTNEGSALLPQIGVKMPDPLSESGRGVALIEMMMDSVQYLSRSGNTTVRMRKNLHPEEVR